MIRELLTLLGFCTDEGVVQLRQRVKVGGFFQKVASLSLVAFGLVCLAQAVEVRWILVAGLLQFGDRGIVIFLRERDTAG